MCAWEACGSMKLVAVSSHHASRVAKDVGLVPWLAPDWVWLPGQEVILNTARESWCRTLHLRAHE